MGAKTYNWGSFVFFPASKRMTIGESLQMIFCTVASDFDSKEKKMEDGVEVLACCFFQVAEGWKRDKLELC